MFRASYIPWKNPPLCVFIALLASSLPCSPPACAQSPPPQPRRPGANGLPKPPSDDLNTRNLTKISVQDLVRALVGPGVAVSNITFTGSPIAAGTFTGGTGIIGFERGVILSTGNIASVRGPNTQPNTTTALGTPGDTDLENLVRAPTFDATVLEFDLQCQTSLTVSFQYVFSSEEYDEFVDDIYNDVFAFFLNGQNIAFVPGTSVPVAINNVNCGNPYCPPNGTYCPRYINNNRWDTRPPTCPAYPPELNTEMDGLTILFSATATLRSGQNRLKLAIADVEDSLWDSNIFIRGESITCGNILPVFDPPSPCGQTLPASVGALISFEVVALATNGMPGQAVTIHATGIPAGAGHDPPLPVGPSQPARTTFTWTPGSNQTGNHVIRYTATDQLGTQASCAVTIAVGLVAVVECQSLASSTQAVTPGGSVTFTLTLRNTGSSPGLVDIVVSATPPDAFVGPVPLFSQNGVVVPASGTAVLPFTRTFSNSPPPSVTVATTVIAVPPTQVPTPSPVSCSLTLSAAIVECLSLAANTQVINPGGAVDFTLVLRNVGGSPGQVNVVVSASPPEGFTGAVPLFSQTNVGVPANGTTTLRFTRTFSQTPPPRIEVTTAVSPVGNTRVPFPNPLACQISFGGHVIPTLSEIGLVLLALSLAVAGWWSMSRRRFRAEA